MQKKFLSRGAISTKNMISSRTRVVFVDLSGTLHVDDTPTQGAVEALNRLKSSNVNVKFVTNTTKESKLVLYERLVSMGFNIRPNEIYTSLIAARNLVDKLGVRPMLLLEKDAFKDFAGLDFENPNGVVVGLAPSQFDYETMNRAFKLILEGAPLIAVHKGRYYQRKDGAALGPGPFVAALEYATDTKATVVGKPDKLFFLNGLEEFNCKPEDAIMIGDDVRDDVGGAQAAGMTGILVRTGKYRVGDEGKITPGPNYICDSFQDAVNCIVDKLTEF